MKWLAVACAGVAAVAIAVAVVWRVYRGRNVVLRGKFSPRVARLVVIFLVLLGWGRDGVPGEQPALSPAEKKRAEKLLDAAGDELPEAVQAPVIAPWLVIHSRSQNHRYMRHERWRTLKTRMTTDVLTLNEGELTELRQLIQGQLHPLRDLFAVDVEAKLAKKAPPVPTPQQFLAAYDAAESSGYYDHWLNAYLWRKTATLPAANADQLAAIFARMTRHARITDTLLRAQGEVKPVMSISPSAWRSKAGPRPQYQAKDLGDMLAAAKRLYPAMDGGTWKRDGVALLSVAKDSPAPTLLRAGQRKPWTSGATQRFGRLDLIETPPGDKPVTIEHAWLGRITLPAGRTISVWRLPEFLSAESQQTLHKAVQAALAGDEEAADNLELALPLAHAVLRRGLAAAPQAKLAPRLRMILSLFDDAIMPGLAAPDLK